MACVRQGSLVDCIKGDEVHLVAVENLCAGDLVYDFYTDTYPVVQEVLKETISELAMYRIFGLSCASPQSILFDNSWCFVDTVIGLSAVVEKNVEIVGIVLNGSGVLCVDGVICRGIPLNVIERERMKKSEAIAGDEGCHNGGYD